MCGGGSRSGGSGGGGRGAWAWGWAWVWGAVGRWSVGGRCCGPCGAAGAGHGVLAQPREVLAQAWANSVLRVVLAGHKHLG